MPHCPGFMFDVAAARTASEFLSSELGLESFSKKYFEGLCEHYEDITHDEINGAAEDMLQFLAEIEAGDSAFDLLISFSYFRIYFEGPNRPRKIKPMFGSIEDPVKVKEWSKETSSKSFRAFVFGLRSNTVPHAPTGWLLENEEATPVLAKLAAEKLSLIDIL
ncbi:hypothetical protein AB3X55_09050 [Alphaproteobacteria bacterium LSUCC0719]